MAEGVVIASHPRCYDKHRQILNPLHYLAILGRRPANLDHSNVFRRWDLPACFGELRDRLEQSDGPLAGSRQYIRVLQLLAEHPVSHVQEAVVFCQGRGIVHVEAIIQRVSHLARQGSGALEAAPISPDGGQLPEPPQPKLGHFDQLLLTPVQKGDLVYG